MKTALRALAVAAILVVSPTLIAQDDSSGFHADYYLGFSQGAYYGLMLAGADYELAWCVKSELAYEAAELGAGGEFQAKLDSIYMACKGSE